MDTAAAAMDTSAATSEALLDELLAERAEHQLAIKRIDALIAEEKAKIASELKDARLTEVRNVLLKLHERAGDDGDDGEVVRKRRHREHTSSGYARVKFTTTVVITVRLVGTVYTVSILLKTSNCSYSGGGTDDHETPDEGAVRMDVPLDDFIAKLSTGRLIVADKFESDYGYKANGLWFESELEDLFWSLIDGASDVEDDDSDSDY